MPHFVPSLFPRTPRLASALQAHPARRNALYRSADVRIATLESLQQALMYGSPERATLGIMSTTVAKEQVSLMLEGACAGAWTDSEAQARCPTFHQGIMTHGVHAAMTAYLQLAKELLAQREQLGREATIASTSMQVMEEFDDEYLWQALWESARLYEEVGLHSETCGLPFMARACANPHPPLVLGCTSPHGRDDRHAVARCVALHPRQRCDVRPPVPPSR